MRIRNIKQGSETLYPLHQVESSGIKWNQVESSAYQNPSSKTPSVYLKIEKGRIMR